MQLRCAFVAINAHYAHTSLALRQLRAHAPECAYFEFHLNQPFRTMADALIEYAPALVGCRAIYGTWTWRSGWLGRSRPHCRESS